MTTNTRKSKTQKASNETVAPLDASNPGNEIEKRAYEIWLSSGCNHGDDVAHWLKAENEILAGRQKNPRQIL